VNIKKSILFAEKLIILRQIIDQDSSHPAPERIDTVIDWKR